MRSRRVLAALVAACVALPAAAYVLPTRALLDKLAERRSKDSARTLRVEGTLEIFAETGARTVIPAVHDLRYPGRCALATDQGDARDGAAWERGRRVAPKDPALEPLMVLESLACPVLAVHDGADREIGAFLAKEGVDTDYTGLSRLEGHPAYLIGAKPWETDKPQLWLDEETFLPVRVIGRVGTVLGDVRLLGYDDPATGEWHPRRMELWEDGALKVRFTAERLDRNVSLDDGLLK